MTMNQRESVYQSTMNVLADAEIAFDDGQNVEDVVTKELRKSVIAVVTASIISGETEMSTEGRAKYCDEQKMRNYVSGLVSNWFRKDKRLNGGVKHEIKNPGSRVGSGDEQLKALKALRATKTDDADALAAIDEAIAARKAEVGTKKVEVTEAQLALIPEGLRAKLGL